MNVNGSGEVIVTADRNPRMRSSTAPSAVKTSTGVRT